KRRHTEKKIICEVCGKAFANESRLELHKTCHSTEKLHECPHCGKSFRWMFALSRHIKQHTDDGKKLFKCHLCQKSYRFERYLKIHEKNVHERQQKYFCKWCNQEFISQAELLIHWKTHNEGIFSTDTNPNISSVVGELQCSECGRMFSTRDNLRKHTVLHTEHFPFTCEICGVGFRWKESV
uniref:C2H2-type domain-containing protein n=1 Tax=Lutzomyia longipalpis TaxID=7200 RepID=A0A1B0CAE6_LUTLO